EAPQPHKSAASTKKRSGLAFAKGNSTFGKVVRGKFDFDAIARDDANEIFTHATGDVRGDQVASFDLHTEARVGQRLGNDAIGFERFFLLLFFRHQSDSQRSKNPTSNSSCSKLISPQSRNTGSILPLPILPGPGRIGGNGPAAGGF